MHTWRVFTPRMCRVVIEETKYHVMHQFDGMTEEEVIETVRRNMLNEWPEAQIRESSQWDKKALEVSNNGTYYLEEPEEPPALYFVAQGIKPLW